MAPLVVLVLAERLSQNKRWRETFEQLSSCLPHQVYKAKLRNTGETVAVKIQRPKVLATVTRDLYVIRIILDLLGYVDSRDDLGFGTSSLTLEARVYHWSNGYRYAALVGALRLNIASLISSPLICHNCVPKCVFTMVSSYFAIVFIVGPES